METRYVLLGYSKDYDLYVQLREDLNLTRLTQTAKAIAKEQVKTDKYKYRDDPYDWFVITTESHKDYPIDSEILWASYQDGHTVV